MRTSHAAASETTYTRLLLPEPNSATGGRTLGCWIVRSQPGGRRVRQDLVHNHCRNAPDAVTQARETEHGEPTHSPGRVRGPHCTVRYCARCCPGRRNTGQAANHEAPMALRSHLVVFNKPKQHLGHGMVRSQCNCIVEEGHRLSCLASCTQCKSHPRLRFPEHGCATGIQGGRHVRAVNASV